MGQKGRDHLLFSEKAMKKCEHVKLPVQLILAWATRAHLTAVML
nr:unnamed protein product [Digitaria exilis]